MSHPKDKRDRFLKGECKGRKRTFGDALVTKGEVPRWIRMHRNTTKLCSCTMCGNPRRKWKKITLQEERENDRARSSDG